MTATTIYKEFPITMTVTRKNGGRITINTAGLDRDHDRVLPIGAKIDNYLRNPIVQWGHDYRSPWATIGKTTSLEVSPEGIIADFELRPAANESDPQNIIRLLWEGGWVRTASIGFMPVKAKPNDMGGTDFEEWELLEWSVVSVPSNQDALRLALKALDNQSEVADVEVLKPFPNEHACRLVDPAKFESDSFRRISREADGKPLDMILGRLKGEDTLTLQSYRYPKDDWQEAEARKHCTAHDGILFEPATEKGRKQNARQHLSAAMAALESCGEHLSAMAEMMSDEEGAGKGVEQKRGRVLSAKNEQRLRSARDALDEVLSQLEDTPEIDDEKNIPPRGPVKDPVSFYVLTDESERELSDALQSLTQSLKGAIS
jgi:HK97 family phage prohead protease